MPDIKDKIAKLLALAESPNEHEAKAAMLKARALMAANKLSERDIQNITESQKLIRRTIGIAFTELSTPWVLTIAQAVARHYCCAAYQSVVTDAKRKTVGLIGLEDDFEVCAQVCRYALGYVSAECERIKAANRSNLPAKVIRKATIAYGYGFCEGLKRSFEKQDMDHQEWGLVLQISKAVKDEVDSMNTVKRKNPKIDPEQEGFLRRGYRDGSHFELQAQLKASV